MPSIEYQGLKFTGGKFFIIISLIGAIIGGGWTGYKFYDDYLDMKQQVQDFVAPVLSSFDKRIELIQQEVSMLNEEMQMILSEVELVASTAKELAIKDNYSPLINIDDVENFFNRESSESLEDYL